MQFINVRSDHSSLLIKFDILSNSKRISDFSADLARIIQHFSFIEF